jgi:hypothetical protein
MANDSNTKPLAKKTNLNPQIQFTFKCKEIIL